MNAEEAKQLAKEAAEKKVAELLEDIRDEIARAAKAGKLSLDYPAQLSIAVKKELRKEHFVVTSGRIRDSEGRIENGAHISWQKSTDKLDPHFTSRDGK
jgi:hypothetical protein